MRVPVRIAPLGLALLLSPGALAQGVDDLTELAWDEDEEWAEDDVDADDDLTDLSLEDLMNIDVEVTSVSRKSENLRETPAAAYVISAEDIRRVGARSIPEALRLAPGLRVARLTSGQYSVSARGFSWLYSDKLLVLIDGRSVYQPRFSGTEWETIDIPVEDVERIEVIRGPGGTMWGANAVNGVVNIITKSAADVQQESVTLVYGDEERLDAQIRGGTSLGDGFLRAYARYNQRGPLATNSTGIESEFEQARFGLRTDVPLSDDSDLLVQAGAFQMNNQHGTTYASRIPPYVTIEDDDRVTTGGSLFGRWTKRHGSGSTSTLQATFAGSETRAGLISENRQQFDLWFQNQSQIGDRNEVVWGASFRYTNANYIDTPVMDWLNDRNDKLYAGFVQDEIAVTDDFDLTLGVKVEDNPYTDVEVQPQIRGLYRLGERTSVWASVSRAIQTPAEAYRTARILYGYVPDMGSGFDTQIVLNPQMTDTPESVIAYEAGFRTPITDTISLDVAAFYNDYDEVGTITFGSPFFVNAGLLEQPITGEGTTEIESYGVEAAARFLVTKSLDVNLSYSYIRLNERNTGPAPVIPWDFDRETPKHIAHARAFYDISDRWQLDGAVYFVSDQGGDTPIDQSFRADVRLGWQPNDRVSVSLVGQGLFHDDEPEIGPDFGGDQYGAQAGAFVNVTLNL